MKRNCFLIFLLVAFFVNASAQKFYYEGGYFEKNGSKWFEYKPSQKDGVWNWFTEVDNQKDWYIIDNGNCKVAVPKSTSNNFLIKLKGQSDWQFKYKSIKSGQTVQSSSIYSRLKELVNQTNAQLKANPVVVNGLKLEYLELAKDAINFGYRDTKHSKKHYDESYLRTWQAQCRKVLVGQLKAYSTSDEMIRLGLQGGYKFIYIYMDKKYDLLFEVEIASEEIR